MKKYYLLILTTTLFFSENTYSQSVPAADENIPYLVTFGSNALTSWGDDDFIQIFYFIIPSAQTEPVYIRVFDPETGDNLDELKEQFNTQTKFSIYGGNNCWTENNESGEDSTRRFDSGIILASKTFGSDPQYDEDYYAFGPFNPAEGEYVEKFDGYIFKVIAEGISGDDGNLYRYFLSTRSNQNIPVEGGNAFTYKYCFRLPNQQNQVCQIYPFVDDLAISIEVSNFDWDHDGQIKLISVAKNGFQCQTSGENNWKKSEFPILEDEKNTSFELQFIKDQERHIKNNNAVVMVKNQYGQSLPFYVVPIGGIPVYTPKIRMKSIQ